MGIIESDSKLDNAGGKIAEWEGLYIEINIIIAKDRYAWPAIASKLIASIIRDVKDSNRIDVKDTNIIFTRYTCSK